MKRLIAMCAAAGALAIAAPAFATTVYTDPATGQTYVVADHGWGGPVRYVTAPVGMIMAPAGMVLQPASGALGGITGADTHLVPVNPRCYLQTDFTGKHTAMCGP